MPEATPRRWRPGLRAQLLMLLLPGVLALLAFDAWSDWRGLTQSIENAYDEALLEPLAALDEGVHLDTQGRVALAAPFAVEAMFESIQARHKHLAARLLPIDGGPTRQLLGADDLPAPPAGLAPAAERITVNVSDAADAKLFFHESPYRDYTVRIATLQHAVTDGAGRHWLLRIQAAESTGRRTIARQEQLQRQLWQAVRMLAVTVLLVWFGIAWALRPLARLRAALRARQAHDLRPLEASSVPAEVAPLVDAVNQHIADHRQVLEQQHGFLADASHQLRTPLAIMMAQAGYALREQDPQRMRETFAGFMAQLARSSRLSDQLLALAHASRAEPAAGETPRPQADLNAVAREVVLQHLPLAREKSIDLGFRDLRGEDVQDDSDRVGAGPVLPVPADAAELHEALANLLHNAIRHTPRDGAITVAVRFDGIEAAVEVRDSGPGIPPERRDAVFERFQRGGGGDGKGSGLGLAIARAYARRNGGDIVLHDAGRLPPGGPGLAATLVLTLRKPALPHSQ